MEPNKWLINMIELIILIILNLARFTVNSTKKGVYSPKVRKIEFQISKISKNLVIDIFLKVKN